MSYVDHIARLRITLNDTKPPIWRIVEVPLTSSLKGLHEVIQAAMPFENYHLFDFRVGEQRYAIPVPEFDGPETRHAKLTKLGALIEKGFSEFVYTYDFGDNWQHTVTVEEVTQADPTLPYPRLVGGERRAPPEDVGGTWGFEEFVEAMTKPRHSEKKAMLTWYGGPFDPEAMDRETIEAAMAKLAKRRAIGRAAFAKGQRHNG
jgi:hypothetical protein